MKTFKHRKTTARFDPSAAHWKGSALFGFAFFFSFFFVGFVGVLSFGIDDIGDCRADELHIGVVMKKTKRIVLAILAAGMWIGASEFIRNELLFKYIWIDHYAGLGLVFPSAMINNAVWGIWSFVFAGTLYVLSRKFSLIAAAVLGWVMGFVLMWLTVANLGVLPLMILLPAVPLSALEVFLALLILRRIDPVTI
jgi:hypothetical protein